jgi:regulator of replication initiation timing
MLTGRQTLASIEDAISKLHLQQGQLEQALQSAVSETERLRAERSANLRELARIKLDEMAAGRLVGDLDAG